MFSLRQTLRMALPLLCVLLISICRVESFEVGPKVIKNHPSTSRHQQLHSSNQNPQYFSINKGHQTRLSTPSSSLVVLDAKKKKIVEEKQEMVKTNGFEKVLLFMTPWRNPNSIFVYMFATVYFLGKYSEAQSIAASASGAL